MPVKSRTIYKVKHIVSLLGNGFSYNCDKKGKYSFEYLGSSIPMSTSTLWRNTSDECVALVRRGLAIKVKEDYFERNNIDHEEGYRYVYLHQKRNEDYLRYLQGVG